MPYLESRPKLDCTGTPSTEAIKRDIYRGHWKQQTQPATCYYCIPSRAISIAVHSQQHTRISALGCGGLFLLY